MRIAYQVLLTKADESVLRHHLLKLKNKCRLIFSYLNVNMVNLVTLQGGS